MSDLRPVTVWACVTADGRIDVSSLRWTRALSIKAFENGAHKPWTWWRRHHGWRCVKVRVTAPGEGEAR